MNHREDWAPLMRMNGLGNKILVIDMRGRTDKVTKAVEYFRVPALVHYLVVEPATRVMTHHHRSGDDITLTEHTGGTVTLDPPGITVDIDALWQVIR